MGLQFNTLLFRPFNFELKLVVRFKDAHMLVYKIIRNMNDKRAVHYIYTLVAFLPFKLKPLKASTEVDSEITVISDDSVRS